MQITAHVSHDGWPDPMKRLISDPAISPVAEVLVPTLRRDPRRRPSAEELRTELRAAWSLVDDVKWPVSL